MTMYHFRASTNRSSSSSRNNSSTIYSTKSRRSVGFPDISRSQKSGAARNAGSVSSSVSSKHDWFSITATTTSQGDQGEPTSREISVTSSQTRTSYTHVGGSGDTSDRRRSKSGGLLGWKNKSERSRAKAQKMSELLEQSDGREMGLNKNPSVQQKSAKVKKAPTFQTLSVKEVAKKIAEQKKAKDQKKKAQMNSKKEDVDSLFSPSEQRKLKRLEEEKARKADAKKKKSARAHASSMVFAVNKNILRMQHDQENKRSPSPPTDERGLPLHSSVFQKKTEHERRESSRLLAAQMAHDAEMADEQIYSELNKDGIRVEKDSSTESKSAGSKVAGALAELARFAVSPARQRDFSVAPHPYSDVPGPAVEQPNNYGYLPASYSFQRTISMDGASRTTSGTHQPYSLNRSVSMEGTSSSRRRTESADSSVMSHMLESSGSVDSSDSRQSYSSDLSNSYALRKSSSTAPGQTGGADLNVQYAMKRSQSDISSHRSGSTQRFDNSLHNGSMLGQSPSLDPEEGDGNPFPVAPAVSARDGPSWGALGKTAMYDLPTMC